jgi:hypothetical protein
MPIDHIPRCTSSWYLIHLHIRMIYVFEEFASEAGVVTGRDLRFDGRRIRSLLSWVYLANVVLLDGYYGSE